MSRYWLAGLRVGAVKWYKMGGMGMNKVLPNKEAMHLSFYGDDGKLVTEHIPKPTGRVGRFFGYHWASLLIRYHRPLYYWNIRHEMSPLVKKAEDLRFIDHVMTDHNGKPPTVRESTQFRKAMALYGTEYERLAKHIFVSQRQKEVIDHPYAKAYIKMWKLDREPQWKMMYHGVGLGDFIDIHQDLLNSYDREVRKATRRTQRANKKLQIPKTK